MIDRLRGAPPHDGQPIVTAGAPVGTARAVGILLHGRGASAESILELADAVGLADVAWLAPQAVGRTWYPNRFVAPLEANEPWLSSALGAIGHLVAEVEAAGTPATRIIVGGFSQGGCLALEYGVRNPRRYGGLVGLSAGLIGPPGTRWPAAGQFHGTPVFLGCSDQDSHIPAPRVEESALVFRGLGAAVTARLYPGLGHTVTDDEIEALRAICQRVIET